MKYIYKFCVYKNNMRDGVQYVTAFKNIYDALSYKNYIQNTGGGCCDVVKKRFLINDAKPINNSIYNNTLYY